MSIVITGDTHGTFDIGKVVRYFNEHEDEYTRDDYLIICGDVGICGFSAAYEANTRAVFRSLPVTTLFIDGNHENFEQLNFYAVEQWNGGKVHIIEDNMIHLMRGQIFTIDGLKFFTFGGAYSIDKMSRAEGISWFPEEVPGRNSVTGRVRRRMEKSGKRRFPGGLHTDPHRPKRCGRGNGVWRAV